jgi:uncharacterized protein
VKPHSCLLGFALVWMASLPSHAQNLDTAAEPVALALAPMPYFTAEQALQGLYAHQLPPLARRLVEEAERLEQVSAQHCEGKTTLAELRDQWLSTLVSWQTLATPALGPVVVRRSQRQIDFWPARDKLIQRALDKAPRTLDDMERVGTPAKGFPALEVLLQTARQEQRLPANTCRYAVLVAQGIGVEARAVATELDTLARRDWSESPEAAGNAFAEWVNQWLGGLERLRWAHMEKPLQAHRTSGEGNSGARQPIEFPRLTREANLADWRAQWQSLKAQARLRPGQYAQPPVPGQALVPIEALLIGKGQLALAQRWARSLDAVDAGMAALSPSSGERELLALTSQMKAVTVLYQNEVAAALDVPLGFSDADGD